MHSSDTSGDRTPTLGAHIIVIVMTGNHCANNQKDPYVSIAHIPVELTYIVLPVTGSNGFAANRPSLPTIPMLIAPDEDLRASISLGRHQPSRIHNVSQMGVQNN